MRGCTVLECMCTTAAAATQLVTLLLGSDTIESLMVLLRWWDWRLQTNFPISCFRLRVVGSQPKRTSRKHQVKSWLVLQTFELFWKSLWNHVELSQHLHKGKFEFSITCTAKSLLLWGHWFDVTHWSGGVCAFVALALTNTCTSELLNEPAALEFAPVFVSALQSASAPSLRNGYVPWRPSRTLDRKTLTQTASWPYCGSSNHIVRLRSRHRPARIDACWANELAKKNISLISFTWRTSHWSNGWLNDVARPNIPDISITCCTFQPFNGWLNADAP